MGDHAAFDDLVEDFQCTAAGVRAQLQDLRSGASAADRTALMGDAEARFEEARGKVKQLEVMVRPLAPAEKRELTPTLKLCQSEAARLRREVVQGREWVSKDALVGGRAAQKMGRLARDQRGRLLEARGAQAETTVAIDDTRRGMHTSERVGGSVLVALQGQRETLQRARAVVASTDEALDRVRSALRTMARRTVTNKLITGLIIVLLLLTIALIVSVKFLGVRLG